MVKVMAVDLKLREVNVTKIIFVFVLYCILKVFEVGFELNFERLFHLWIIL